MMTKMKLLKSTYGRAIAEVTAEQRRLAAIHGNVYDQQGGGKALPDLSSDTGMPIVRPGDASVAAPFTSRSPSVRNIVDLIRQGR